MYNLIWNRSTVAVHSFQSSVKRHGVTFENGHQNRKLVIISLKITNSTSQSINKIRRQSEKRKIVIYI